jgi:hypothetical protein
VQLTSVSAVAAFPSIEVGAIFAEIKIVIEACVPNCKKWLQSKR